MMHQIIKAHVHTPDVLPGERDSSAYKRLASSVIRLAFHDAQKKPCSGDDCMDARRFLCGESWALRFWCHWLNVHPDRIRAEAQSRGWCRPGSTREGNKIRRAIGPGRNRARVNGKRIKP